MLDVEMAKLELSRKSLSDIHTDTAWKWASRACAAFQISLELTGVNKSLKFSEGQDYLGEAKEHASQVGSILLEKIEIATGQDFMDALLSLDKSF
ncbi:MAG: hypothetical protein HC840_00665 [Leptolyngbyaceae cyanobacterium RM2_2_4]|nr:hypothetical protein [Leptolyngbyaceae cyanobacterium RM2_2_4]